MEREKDTPKCVWLKRVCHFWWCRENYGFTGQPSTRLSKLTKLISAWFTSTRGVCVYYWQDWSLALSSLGLSVFFGQSQTTFFWRANESRLINIRTWEIEWLLSERHGLCVCCHCISAAGHPGSVMCQDSLSIGCLKRPSYYCLNTTTRGKFPRDP